MRERSYPAGNPPAATSYPSDNSSYSLGNGESFYDGQELGPQFRFQADWVFFTRQNRAKDLPVIDGPESLVAAIHSKAPGDNVTLTYADPSGASHTVQVTLGTMQS